MKKTWLLILALTAGALAQDPGALDPHATPTPTPVPSATPVASPDPAAAQKALSEARELAAKGFTESAIVAYRKAIELDPTLVPAYAEFGQILVDTRNQAYAITVYTKLSQLEPNNLKWREMLFELHTAYEMPRDAVGDGEALLAVRPDDIALLKRMEQLYRDLGLLDKLGDTRMKLGKLENKGQWYYDAGEAYVAAGRDSTEAYQAAVALEPNNLDFQTGLGRSLAGEDAVEHFQKLVDAHPEAPGQKDRLADAYVNHGDRLLQRGRYVAAREAYERAQELAGNQLGSAVTERIAKARRLNHVYLDNRVDSGTNGVNGFTWVRNVVGVPLDNIDMEVQVWNDTRIADAPGQGTQVLQSVLAGVDYEINEYANVFAVGGTNGLFRVGGFYQDDNLVAGASVRQDVVSYTPGAIQQRLSWLGVNANLGYNFNEWFGLNGDVGFNNYTDGIGERVYNFGPSFYPVNKPHDFIWTINANHGGVFNDRDANPLLRFGPTNFQVNSYGTNIQHWLGEDFHYHLGYYYSTTNNFQGNGSTYTAGFDAQLGEGSYLWLNYELGNFLAGRILSGVYAQNNQNYTIQAGLRITW